MKYVLSLFYNNFHSGYCSSSSPLPRLPFTTFPIELVCNKNYDSKSKFNSSAACFGSLLSFSLAPSQLDLEKALISAELSTELKYLSEMENNLSVLQAKIHRLEAQRNANRVLQETQQNKLRQSIEMKQNQVEG